MKTDSDKLIVGSNELIEVAGIKGIPAKIDTGADTSSIWASNINMETDGTLVFSLFDTKSPLYTGELLKTKDYRVKSVRSSHGDTQIRYRVKLPIIIKNMSLETSFTLSNRSRNRFPVLIGRHTLEGRFIVDVSQSVIPSKPVKKSKKLSQELAKDPYKFHQKYLNDEEEK